MSGAAAALRATIAATADPTEREADEAELELHIRPDDASPGHGGYVVDCLRRDPLIAQLLAHAGA